MDEEAGSSQEKLFLPVPWFSTVMSPPRIWAKLAATARENVLVWLLAANGCSCLPSLLSYGDGNSPKPRSIIDSNGFSVSS